MSTKDKKTTPFGRYFEILYNQQKGIYRKRFLIYLLRSFALYEKAIDIALKEEFKKNELEYDINNLEKEEDVPDIYLKYVKGPRKLPVPLLTACSEQMIGVNDNVNDRIETFLIDYIPPERQQEVVNQIHNLFQKFQLTDETLSGLSKLVQRIKNDEDNKKDKIKYFRQTFQLVLTAEYKAEVVKDEPIEGLPDEDDKLIDITNEDTVQDRFLRKFRIYMIKYRIDNFIRSRPPIPDFVFNRLDINYIKEIENGNTFIGGISLGINENWMKGAKTFIETVKKDILIPLECYHPDPYLINTKKYITDFVDSMESFIIKIKKNLKFQFDDYWLSCDETKAISIYREIIEHHNVLKELYRGDF